MSEPASEDWADAKARECYRQIWARAPLDAVEADSPIIAAALREERAAALAEARRAVEHIRDHEGSAYVYAPEACDAILARLKALR